MSHAPSYRLAYRELFSQLGLCRCAQPGSIGGDEMDTIQLTAELLKLRRQPIIKPIEHWKTHCVNCGSHKDMAHTRTDCPPQLWEITPPTTKGQDE